jgi:hypothetical protein
MLWENLIQSVLKCAALHDILRGRRTSTNEGQFEGGRASEAAAILQDSEMGMIWRRIINEEFSHSLGSRTAF